MSNFSLFASRQFREDLDEIPNPRREKIAAKLQQQVYPQLRENPYYGPNIKKLRGYEPATWRYRIGDFRLLYEIDDERVVVLAALSLRKDAY